MFFVFGVAIIVVCSIFVLPLVLAERLPEPTGPFSVGTTLVDLSDGRRSSGTLLARIWYPATLSGHDLSAPYYFGNVKLSLRDYLLEYLVRTQSSIDAFPKLGRHPIVIYVAGLGGRRTDNSTHAQEFASHGYVVVGLDDTQPMMPLDFASPQGIHATLDDGNRKVERQAIDVRTAIDALQRIDQTVGDRFYGRLNTNHIVTFGFSFGGAVAAEVANLDSRVLGAINLDGSMFGAMLTKGLAKPFLMMAGQGESSADDAGFDRNNSERLARALHVTGGYVVELSGAWHYNFNDASLLPSLRRTGRGPIDARRGHRLISKYVLAFLDEAACARHSPLFDLSDSLEPGVRVTVYAGESGRVGRR